MDNEERKIIPTPIKEDDDKAEIIQIPEKEDEEPDLESRGEDRRESERRGL